jgi:hypothetical protein
VLVADGGASLLIAGDLLVHAIQLVDPELAYLYETDPAAARASRIAMLGGAPILATSHLGEPFGYSGRR